MVEICRKATWEALLAGYPSASFLQSWDWAKFQTELGLKVFRFDLGVGVGFFVLGKTRFGSYLLCPGGPLFKVFDNPSLFSETKAVLEKIKSFAIDLGAIFVRFEPRLESTLQRIALLADLGLEKGTTEGQHRVTWVLDLSPSEGELLAKMRKTTRYLIRHADLGIAVRQKAEPSDIDVFEELLKETTRRGRFPSHVLSLPRFFRRQLKVFGATQSEVLLLSVDKKKKSPLAGAVILFYRGVASYLYAASSREGLERNAPTLLVWEAIREAKRRGCQTFDFYGIADSERENHPWRGLTLFKQGFGGRRVELLGSWDLRLDYRYPLVRLMERARKLRRGY